ncbi:MAG: hydroxymethylbilane synthase [Deltaproteobacteria bacterium]|nr:hydroxymethylbilane synthase [Deltaproteobacteria bacterium]
MLETSSVAFRPLIIGTRGSPLALWQAHFVQKGLQAKHLGLKISIRAIKTSGDKLKKASLAKIGGKGLFIKEIEEALLAGKIDLAVHSMKDLPIDLPDELQIFGVLKREDPRDVFVSKKYDSILGLPRRSVIGTGSLRRQAQLKNFRPDFKIVPVRGNVETRLRKIGKGGCDAMILAAAGLIRLGFTAKIREYLPTTLMIPAVGQGVIGIEGRVGDPEAESLARSLNDPVTEACLLAERSFLKELGGDCQSPIAGYAEPNGLAMELTGLVASPDGRELIRDQVTGFVKDPVSLGRQMGRSLLAKGAKEILKSCRDEEE